MGFYDKHGEEIKEGMTIQHIDGDKDTVYMADNGSLGLKANKGDIITEVYPLTEFDLDEWEILK